MTETIYYDDPTCLEFTARVTGIAEAHGTTEITLDRTAFYPEGGGQPSDQGFINASAVTHVRKDDGAIVHVVPDSRGAGFTVGETINARVDAARRRDFMQQHTGQHIISAALLAVGGYNTVSVHLGEDYATIEVDRPDIREDDLAAVEQAANDTIRSCLPVTSRWVTDSELENYQLRREPKVGGSIRLVQVGDADCVACGGVHVASSADVRLVRSIGTETIRGNIRISWKIGDRALSHYRETSTIVGKLGDLLSARPEEVIERVETLADRLRQAEAWVKRAREDVYRLTAGNLISVTDTGTPRVITAEFTDVEKDFLRGVCSELATTEGVCACLVSLRQDELQWCIAVGPAASVDPGAFLKELLPLISGKGGGRSPMWQGIGANPAGAGEFISRFRGLAGAD